MVVQKLRHAAIKNQSSGQSLVVERKHVFSPRKTISVYAVATNIVGYCSFLASSRLPEDILKRFGSVAKRHNENVSSADISVKKVKCL